MRFCRGAPEFSSVEADRVQGLWRGFGTRWHSVLEVINAIITLHDPTFATDVAWEPRMTGRVHVPDPDRRTAAELWL